MPRASASRSCSSAAAGPSVRTAVEPPRGLDDPDRLLDGALLVRAHREAEVPPVDLLSVGVRTIRPPVSGTRLTQTRMFIQYLPTTRAAIGASISTGPCLACRDPICAVPAARILSTIVPWDPGNAAVGADPGSLGRAGRVPWAAQTRVQRAKEARDAGRPVDHHQDEQDPVQDEVDPRQVGELDSQELHADPRAGTR